MTITRWYKAGIGCLTEFNVVIAYSSFISSLLSIQIPLYLRKRIQKTIMQCWHSKCLHIRLGRLVLLQVTVLKSTDECIAVHQAKFVYFTFCEKIRHVSGIAHGTMKTKLAFIIESIISGI